MLKIFRNVSFVVIFLSCSALWQCSRSTSPTNAVCSAPTALTVANEWTPDQLVEPSGIVFHRQRGTLFVIGDQGDIEEMRLDGSTVKSAHLGSRDFEGITCNPATGLLYAVEENHSRIYEIDPLTFSVRRKFDIDWTLNGAEVLNPKKEHLEGVTFIADSTHEQGGLFYVVNRSNNPQDEESPSAIFELELQIADPASKPSPAKTLGVLQLDFTSLSGIYFDDAEQSFYLVSDDNDALYRVDRSGALQGCFDLPGDKQEGIAKDADGFEYIADDRGNAVLKLEK